jgi:hypothetical protein
MGNRRSGCKLRETNALPLPASSSRDRREPLRCYLLSCKCSSDEEGEEEEEEEELPLLSKAKQDRSHVPHVQTNRSERLDPCYMQAVAQAKLCTTNVIRTFRSDQKTYIYPGTYILKKDNVLGEDLSVLNNIQFLRPVLRSIDKWTHLEISVLLSNMNPNEK